MHAIGIKALCGKCTHYIILEADSCTFDGKACGTTNGKNVGSDGIKITPYVPIPGFSENMGDYGPGDRGWFVFAGGHALKITVTKVNQDPKAAPMMNDLATVPKMCTNKAMGLCSTTASTKDKLLMSFAESYNKRHAKDAKKGDKTINLLAPQAPGDVPLLGNETYTPLTASSTPPAIPGLAGMSCPAVSK